MRRRGFFIGFDFPFGFYMHRGPFRAFFGEPWRFPHREEYLKMLEEYKREIEEELRDVEHEIEELRRGV